MASTSAPQFSYVSDIHPDRDGAFKKTAALKHLILIKTPRKDSINACIHCGRSGKEEDVDLKKCTRCKIARYCSRDCQKQNWPTHKADCSDDFRAGIGPLIQSVIASPMLSQYIRVCLSLKFNLHNLDHLPLSERTKFIRSPLLVHVNVGIEPTMISDFNHLFTYPDTWDKDDLEGMLQLHNLETGLPEHVLTNPNAAMWKRIRDSADKDGAETCAVVLVQFVNNFRQAITCPIVVGEDALDLARNHPPLTMVSALTGKASNKPFDIPGVFEYLNTHIRSDKKNELLLRTPMREIDKELIRQAARNVQSPAPNALRLKIGREHVYIHFLLDPGDPIPHPVFPLRQVRRFEDDPREEPEPPRVPVGNRAERRRFEREYKKEQKQRRK